jgi:hypothetical protein
MYIYICIYIYIYIYMSIYIYIDIYIFIYIYIQPFSTRLYPHHRTVFSGSPDDDDDVYLI